MQSGTVKSWPLALLRLEGACLLGTTIWAYSRMNQSWWAFAGVLFLPDLGMVGYLANTRLGAVMYNTTHTATPAMLMLCAGWAKGSEMVGGLALCWLAHIGLDRMIGAGLKYGTGFGHTHLGDMSKGK